MARTPEIEIVAARLDAIFHVTVETRHRIVKHRRVADQAAPAALRKQCGAAAFGPGEAAGNRMLFVGKRLTANWPLASMSPATAEPLLRQTRKVGGSLETEQKVVAVRPPTSPLLAAVTIATGEAIWRSARLKSAPLARVSTSARRSEARSWSFSCRVSCDRLVIVCCAGRDNQCIERQPRRVPSAGQEPG